MIEYLGNAIRTISGEDITVCARITDADGKDITSGCSLLFIDKDLSIIAEYAGTYADNTWTFTIPAEATANKEGRYWYRIKYNNDSMCFTVPIYLGR